MNKNIIEFLTKLANKPSYQEYLEENEDVIDKAVSNNLDGVFDNIKMVVEANLHLLVGDDQYATESNIEEIAKNYTLKFIDNASEIVSNLDMSPREKNELLTNINI
jgi:hypothetical protein